MSITQNTAQQRWRSDDNELLTLEEGEVHDKK